jgi:hypothetical protein
MGLLRAPTKLKDKNHTLSHQIPLPKSSKQKAKAADSKLQKLRTVY